MKLLFITCSFVYLFLVQVPRIYCGEEKVHLKIHVPYIIDKQLHTKTVYVHVPKKSEPPKKHEHHEHKHQTPMKKPEEPQHHHHHHHHKHDGHFHHTHNIKPYHGHHNHHHHYPHGKHEGHGSHGGHHHHDIKPIYETPQEHHKPDSKKPTPKQPSPKKPSKKPSHGHLFSTHEDFYHHKPEQISLNPTSDPYALNYYENLSQEYRNDEPQREYEELEEYEVY